MKISLKGLNSTVEEARDGAVAIELFRLAEDGPVLHAELRCTHNTKTDAGGAHPPGPSTYSVLHLPPSPSPSQP